MKKKFYYILALTVIVGITVPLSRADAQVAAAASWLLGQVNASGILQGIIAAISVPILKIMSWFLYLAGLFLNYVIEYTVLNMRDNIAGLTGINTAWKLIKDLMNIFFIFMLIYEGIKLILNIGSTQSVQKFITGIVLAAVLINFSLFFTKVMIDASNVITVGVYQAAMGNPPANAGTTWGLSTKFVDLLKLQTIYSPDAPIESFGNTPDVARALITIFFSGILIIVATFVFLAVGIIFLIRFMVLLILLMLSPVAYMGMALSFMTPYARDWWNSFRSQILFGPLYMLLTWLVLTLMAQSNFITQGGDTYASLMSATSAVPLSSMGLVFNYIIVVGLLIASLIISKKVASEGNRMIGNAVNKSGLVAGTALFGSTAWLGRQTLGRAGKLVAENAMVQEAANADTKGKGAWASIGGGLSRGLLYTANTARDGSFNVRNATIPTSVIADLGRGTIGRTAKGQKWLGADKWELGNIPAGAPLAATLGAGKGETKGYKQLSEEKDKRFREADAKAAAENRTAQDKRDILNGSTATEGTPEFDAMEKAITKQSDKQIEALVSGNRELLNSLNFANSISVRQLEALNKSDQLTESEKDTLKSNRFKAIDAIYDTKVQADLTSTDPIKVKAAQDAIDKGNKRIKALTDTEIEMMDPRHLADSKFIEQMKSSQFEAINKSPRFTSSQKKKIKDMRVDPLLNTLDLSRPTFSYDSALIDKMVLKDLNAKDLAGLASQEVTIIDPTDPTLTRTKKVSLLSHPEVIKRLKVGQLKKITEDMNQQDINTFGDAIRNEITTYDTLRAGATPIPQDTKFEKLKKWFIGKDNDIF